MQTADRIGDRSRIHVCAPAALCMPETFAPCPRNGTVLSPRRIDALEPRRDVSLRLR